MTGIVRRVPSSANHTAIYTLFDGKGLRSHYCEKLCSDVNPQAWLVYWKSRRKKKVFEEVFHIVINVLSMGILFLMASVNNLSRWPLQILRCFSSAAVPKATGNYSRPQFFKNANTSPHAL